MKYFLGIDGGGSKTTAIVTNEKGDVICKEQGKSINYYSVGLEKARLNMLKILEKIYKKCGIKKFRCAFIGMSALNDTATENEIAAFTKGIIFADIIQMDSDLYVAMNCLQTEGECAVIIGGTGSMVLSRDKDRIMRHAGGWGYILGDEGSGYSMALEAIKTAIYSFESREFETSLVGEVMDYFELSNMSELIEKFYNPTIDRTAIASFARRITTCPANGDKKTVEILKKGARELFTTAKILLKDMDKNSPIGLWGGVFENCSIYRNEFCRLLKKFGFTNVSLLNYPPEVGAVMLAMNADGIEINDDIEKNMEKTYFI